jgi:hypothetical protein
MKWAGNKKLQLNKEKTELVAFRKRVKAITTKKCMHFVGM